MPLRNAIWRAPPRNHELGRSVPLRDSQVDENAVDERINVKPESPNKTLLDRKRTLEWRVENLTQMAQSAHSEKGMCMMELQGINLELHRLKQIRPKQKKGKQ